MKYKTLLSISALALSIALNPIMTSNTYANSSNVEDQKTKQNIVIKMGHFTDDLHRVTMALKIGKMLAKKGAKVTLFLNLEAARLADKRQNLDLSWGNSLTIAKLLESAVGVGVGILVCPHCAKAAGIQKKHLRKHAVMGNAESLASLFLNADKVIDY